MVTRFGEPAEALQLLDIDEPPAGDGEALVAVEAVGLNFMDASICRGAYRVRQELPFLAGVELVGRVEAAPPESSLARGTRVVGVRSGEASGALAERITIPWGYLYPIPEDVPADVAAAILITYQTALAAARRTRLGVGDTLLVTAAAGGVGTAAIQLGVARGARVLAGVGHAAKAQVCREEGASEVLEYRADGFVDAVLAATEGKGVDVLFDVVGGEYLERSLACVAAEGRIAPLGFASGAIPALPLSTLLLRNLTLVGVAWGAYYPRHARDDVLNGLAELLELHAQGSIRPRTEVRNFESAAEAIQDLGDGRTTGKIAIRVA